jgi:hypothetical protein
MDTKNIVIKEEQVQSTSKKNYRKLKLFVPLKKSKVKSSNYRIINTNIKNLFFKKKTIITENKDRNNFFPSSRYKKGFKINSIKLSSKVSKSSKLKKTNVEKKSKSLNTNKYIGTERIFSCRKKTLNRTKIVIEDNSKNKSLERLADLTQYELPQSIMKWKIKPEPNYSNKTSEDLYNYLKKKNQMQNKEYVCKNKTEFTDIKDINKEPQKNISLKINKNSKFFDQILKFKVSKGKTKELILSKINKEYHNYLKQQQQNLKKTSSSTEKRPLKIIKNKPKIVNKNVNVLKRLSLNLIRLKQNNGNNTTIECDIKINLNQKPLIKSKKENMYELFY